MDSAQFRADFPEFDDCVAYPDAEVDRWIGLAEKLLPACRWEDMLDLGTELYVAHNLALSTQRYGMAVIGGQSGQIKGPQTSKSVDKVSVGYDVSVVTLKDGGAYNMTSYGIQFLQLARTVGAGGIQL